jgi:hypothetical protein
MRPAQTYSLHDWFGKGPGTMAFDFELGATLTPRLLLGGQLTYFGAAARYPDPSGMMAASTRSLGLTNLNAVLTFFPWERGLFLRGGLGLASAATTTKVPGVGQTSDSAGGGDVAVGIGYAFWLGKGFNLSGNLDWSAQGFGGGAKDKLESTSFWRLGVGLGWY